MTSTTAVQPRLGHLIAGHVLVAYTARPSTGDLAWGVGLFVSPDPTSWHRYVVWELSAVVGKWHAQDGDYCPSLADAIAVYADRGGDLSAVNS